MEPSPLSGWRRIGSSAPRATLRRDWGGLPRLLVRDLTDRCASSLARIGRGSWRFRGVTAGEYQVYIAALGLGRRHVRLGEASIDRWPSQSPHRLVVLDRIRFQDGWRIGIQ